MLQGLKKYQDIVVALINEDQVRNNLDQFMKALDFALEHNVHSMKL